MTTVTADQGITLQVGTDPANLPSAQTSEVGGFENRLFRRYTNTADRTARTVSTVENSVSALASENWADISDGVNWVSLHSRAVRAVRMSADQALTVSSTTLQNLTSLSVPLETNGVFQFDAVLFFDGPTAGDIKFALATIAAASGWYGGAGPIPGIAANAGDGVWGVATSLGGSIAYGTSGTGAGNATVVRWAGEVTTVGTAGNLQIQAAQNTADAGTTTVRARSRLHVWRVL